MAFRISVPREIRRAKARYFLPAEFRFPSGQNIKLLTHEEAFITSINRNQ